MSGLTTWITCEHCRAYIFYIESMSTEKTAFQCENYDDFKSGYCTVCKLNRENCVTFGPNAVKFDAKGKNRLKFYFKTNGKQL